MNEAEEAMRGAINQVALAYNRSPDFVEIIYAVHDDTWAWTVRVREKYRYKKGPSRKRLVIPESLSQGLTLQRAVSESIEKASAYLEEGK